MKLLEQILRKFPGSPAVSDETIRRRQFGKPFLPEGPEFNIAHSENIVVVAVCHETEVGIDIEHLRNIDWRVYADVFMPEEWQVINNSANPSHTLLDLWVRKESILKAEGCGLQVPFTEVILEPGFGMLRKHNKKIFQVAIPIDKFLCYVSFYSEKAFITVAEVSL